MTLQDRNIMLEGRSLLDIIKAQSFKRLIMAISAQTDEDRPMYLVG